MFLFAVYNGCASFNLFCLQAISVLLVALNIVYLLVDETAMPKGSTVRQMLVNKPILGFSGFLLHLLPPPLTTAVSW